MSINKTRNFKVVKGRVFAHSLTLALNRLKTHFGASSVKLSTEDAGMSFEQIRFWIEICQGVLPVIVKIGGPNARNDIKQCLELGADGLIAPMVESAYGFENFLSALKDYATPMKLASLKKQINIETVTAVHNLPEILSHPEIDFLDEITIGCSDLSQSMKKSRLDPELQALVKETVARIRAKGIPVSLGGGISPATIDRILSEVQPNQFNTRVVTFQVQPDTSFRPAVEESVRFELSMLKSDVKHGFISKEEELFRSRELRKRLESSRQKCHPAI